MFLAYTHIYFEKIYISPKNLILIIFTRNYIKFNLYFFKKILAYIYTLYWMKFDMVVNMLRIKQLSSIKADIRVRRMHILRERVICRSSFSAEGKHSRKKAQPPASQAPTITTTTIPSPLSPWSSSLSSLPPPQIPPPLAAAAATPPTTRGWRRASVSKWDVYIYVYIEVRARRQVQSSTACRPASIVQPPSLSEFLVFPVSLAVVYEGFEAGHVSPLSHARTRVQPCKCEHPRSDSSYSFREMSRD